MTPDDRSRLTRYHDMLSAELWPREVARRDHLFRSNHRIDNEHPFAEALDIVLAAHRLRVAGEGCPADCDRALIDRN